VPIQRNKNYRDAANCGTGWLANLKTDVTIQEFGLIKTNPETKAFNG
jgi:hypothetical protein